MPVSPYKPMTWGDEPTSSDKLQQMVNNTQHVYENMPRMQYYTYSIRKTTGIKLMSGIAVVPANNRDWSIVRVEFGTWFTPGCKPVITTGTQLTGGKPRWQVYIKGIGTYYPDHRGMEVGVGADYWGTTVKNIVDQRVFIHWTAVGY